MSIFRIRILACFLLFLSRPLKSTGAVMNPLPRLLPSNNSSPVFNDIALFQSHSKVNSTRANGDKTIWRHCATPKKWLNADFFPQDCSGAVDWLAWEEMRGECARSCEFRSPGAPKKTHQKGQRTPRKYTFSKHFI